MPAEHTEDEPPDLNLGATGALSPGRRSSGSWNGTRSERWNMAEASPEKTALIQMFLWFSGKKTPAPCQFRDELAQALAGELCSFSIRTPEPQYVRYPQPGSCGFEV